MTTWLIRLVLIALPVALLLYWVLLRRKALSTGQDMSAKERRIAITGGIMFVLMMTGLVFIVPFTGNSPEDVYIAPRQVDGKILPGEFISKEEAMRRRLMDEEQPSSSDVEELEPFGD